MPLGSAAARAGLMNGDVILRFDGQPIRDLQALLRATENALITILRFQQESDLRLIVK